MDGYLDARGTAVSPIYFTDWRDDQVGGDANGDGNDSEPGGGWWRGLYVRGGGSASLAHGALRYAGYFDAGDLLESGTGDLTMSHCSVAQVTGHGLKVENSTGRTVLEQSTFADNSLSGLYLKASPVTVIGCLFSGNTVYGVHHEAGDGLEYADQQFLDNGQGSVDSPVRFQGTTEQPGWWRGIHFTGAGSTQLEHCEVAHSGYFDSVGILAGGTGALTLRHSTLRGHIGDALRLTPGNDRLTSQNNVFRDSTRGVRLGLGASWEDVTSDFVDNQVDLLADAGTFTHEIVWALKPAYSVYVNGSITLTETARLTVQPGTVLKFPQYAGVFVDGHLEAPGTAALPIFFTDWRDDTVGGDANRDGSETVAAPGWWRGLFVRGAGSALLQHGILRYAGYFDSVGLAKTGSGNLTVRDWTVAHMTGHGMRVINSTGTTWLENMSFRDNSLSGLCLQNGPVTAVGCAFTDNAQYGILQEINDGLDYASQLFARNGWASVGVNGGTMTANRTWSRGGGEPFNLVVRRSLTVASGATLTVDPGVALQFAQYAPLYVDGSLMAIGTATQPILFHGASPDKGWWRGIQLRQTGSAHLEWCEIAHAGYGDSVGLGKTSSGDLSLRHTTLRDHAGDGLRLNGSTGSHQIDDCRFAGNTHGIRLQNLASPIVLVRTVEQRHNRGLVAGRDRTSRSARCGRPLERGWSHVE